MGRWWWGESAIMVLVVVQVGLEGVYGQLGPGTWKAVKYHRLLEPEIHDDINPIGPVPKSFQDKEGGCSYNNVKGVETFKLSNVNISNRIEIRIGNDYTNGVHQFQGDVMIVEPTDGQTLFQIWGPSGLNDNKSTSFMLRGYRAAGGSLHRYEAERLLDHAYGKWTTVNVIHYKGAKVEIYIDKVLKGSWVDAGHTSNRWKYGAYGTLDTASAEVQWRNIQTFSLFPPKRSPLKLSSGSHIPANRKSTAFRNKSSP